ncbi:hypothetical protein [Jeotgalibacillus haloalkalitolerans]|uniref:Uncharacterized protein n=1 Tax=Jeotgalibacillus haloalkalitolerans TaxID=3104292 RepID=A0ABU5KHW1_9BACL|nr:hypothetical protein [Jeotgalibacillus sp. HH7-29]MDZ5710832.1 hypothetical protein [Jeotgalibacillus sp. HH7-29]
MNQKEKEAYIIKQYQEDEEVMVRIFIQWCHEHNLDPEKIYHEAYPAQPPNSLLQKLKEESEVFDMMVDSGTLINVLQVFGNDDLAFIVSKYAKR